MGSGKRSRFLLVSALAGALVVLGTSQMARAAVMTEPGCTANVLPRNDDDFTPPVPLGFPFYFGGQFYSTVNISNNGYVTFGTQTPLWWVLRNWELFNVPLIAAFHADVDTRAPGTSPVTYGPITVGGRPALCINWVNVGYFDTRDNHLNSFQLVLVDRGDAGPGDVDVLLNYDKIEWESASPGSVDGIGGTLPPRVGIYDGAAVIQELPGSNVISTLLDGAEHALISSSHERPQLGRYAYELRGGFPPLTAVVAGTVLDTNDAPVAGAVVQACPVCFGSSPDACVSDITLASGAYNLTGFAAGDINDCSDWEVTVSPPAGTQLLEGSRDVSITSSSQIIADADLQLRYPEQVPSGTSIVPSRGGGGGTTPTAFWQDPLVLTTIGCGSVFGSTAPIATYTITMAGETVPFRSGTMIETPPFSGTYQATLAPFSPAHGLVTVDMHLICPDSNPGDRVPPLEGHSSFNLYIDPSGWVLDTRGTPLVGAQVSLYRSDSALGPFELVTDGSALMSPKNRNNPDYTDSAGHFGWDTVAGYYVVRAEYPGCVSPADLAQSYVETDILPVPPEWLDLHLILDCEGITPPELTLPGPIFETATSVAGARVSYLASAHDGRDGDVPVTCSAPSGGVFSVGVTEVQCSAVDSSGNEVHGSFAVTVTYGWSNVLRPLDPDGPNRFFRGRPVPVRFSLTGASRAIRNLEAHLFVAKVVGGVPGPELPAEPVGWRDQFHYKACDHEYVFYWSTRGLPVGRYRLRIDLGDGVTHTVPVELR
jgi:HYR domain